MLERTQVYVDTSYLLASFYNAWETGARAQLEIDLPEVVAVLGSMVQNQLKQPVHRQFWYDGIPENGPHRYQRSLRSEPGVQLRAGQLIEWGDRRTQKAVDTRLVADMVIAALKGQVSDIVLVSGDADMLPGVEEAVAAGIRVHLYGFGWDSMSNQLRYACDTTTILDPREDFKDTMRLEILEGPLAASNECTESSEGTAECPEDESGTGSSTLETEATGIPSTVTGEGTLEEAVTELALSEAENSADLALTEADLSQAADSVEAPSTERDATDPVKPTKDTGDSIPGPVRSGPSATSRGVAPVGVNEQNVASEEKEPAAPAPAPKPTAPKPAAPTSADQAKSEPATQEAKEQPSATEPAPEVGSGEDSTSASSEESAAEAPRPAPRPNPGMMARHRKLRSRYVPLPNEVWTSAGEQNPFDIGQQYAIWWFDNAASEEQKDNAHMLSGGGLPPDIDRPLLQFACDTLHEYTLTERQRVGLRDGFHAGIRGILLR